MASTQKRILSNSLKHATENDLQCLLPLQKVAVGTHTFKFIVDGVWQHSSEYPTVEDGAGGFNNVIDVKGIHIPKEAWHKSVSQLQSNKGKEMLC